MVLVMFLLCMESCPRGYHWGAIAEKKSDFVTILNSLLRHILSKVGDDRVRCVKFDGGPEFVTEAALQTYRVWKLDLLYQLPFSSLANCSCRTGSFLSSGQHAHNGLIC